MKELIDKGKLIGITIVISVVIGVVIGSFLVLLNFVTSFREANWGLIFLLPFLGVFTVYAYKNFSKGSERGNNYIIDSIHLDERLPLRMSLFSYIFTLLSHLAGASVGREGTGVQIGGTIGSKVSDYLKLSTESKRILTKAGISAGFGAIFGTPLGGAFFGLEMTSIGKISYESMVPCLISSYVATLVSGFFPIKHLSYQIVEMPAFSVKLLAVVLLAGLLFGFVGRLFIKLVSLVKDFYSRYFKNYLTKALAASLVVLVFLLILNFRKYGGLSLWMLDEAFAGTGSFVDGAMKFIATVLSLGAGFIGGEATPLFDIGASLGGSLGLLFGLEASLFAALGLIGVFGSATNTPLTTIMLGIELFGIAALPYYILIAVVSYYVIGHNSIYTSQRVEIAKFSDASDCRGKSVKEINEERKKIK